MRRFHLHRIADETGTSGVGVIAEGVVFTDGTTVLRWNSVTPSTVIFETTSDCKGFDAMRRVHGHEGKTKVIWRDE